MTDWLPVHQISGVVSTSCGNICSSFANRVDWKQKILHGIAAVVGLLAIGAGIWVFFFRAADEKKQFANNDEGAFRSQSQLKKQRRKWLISLHE